MTDQNFKSLREHTLCHESDNEFYDAFETMEHKVGASVAAEGLANLNLADKNDEIEERHVENFSDSDEDFMTMRTDFKDLESKEFQNRHNNLTKSAEVDAKDEQVGLFVSN